MKNANPRIFVCVSPGFRITCSNCSIRLQGAGRDLGRYWWQRMRIIEAIEIDGGFSSFYRGLNSWLAKWVDCGRCASLRLQALRTALDGTETAAGRAGRDAHRCGLYHPQRWRIGRGPPAAVANRARPTRSGRNLDKRIGLQMQMCGKCGRRHTTKPQVRAIYRK